MSRDAVRKALVAMCDGALRDGVAKHEFEDLAGLQLTDPERQLVVDAARDWPDAAGFDFSPADFGSMVAWEGSELDMQKNEWATFPPGLRAALQYCSSDARSGR